MKTILKLKVGSWLYGLHNEKSDTDYYSVYMQSNDELMSFTNLQVDEYDLGEKVVDGNNVATVDSVDHKAMSLRKFLDCLLHSTPNSVEILFSGEESIIETSDVFKEIVENKHLFISNKVFTSYDAYIKSQAERMNKHYRLLTTRRTALKLIDLQKENITVKELYLKHKELFDREGSLEIVIREGGKEFMSSNMVRKQFYPTVKISEFKSIIEKIMESSSNRKILIDTYGYDTKSMYNVLRLQTNFIELLSFGKIILPIVNNRDIILAVKEGRKTFEEAVEHMNEWQKEIDRLSLKSELRLVEPKRKEVNDFLIYLQKKYGE